MKKLLLGVCLFPLLLLGCTQKPDINKQFSRGDSSPFSKIDNPVAQDISFAELSLFLNDVRFEADMPTVNACGWYAQDLHNMAEGEGIRAAIVVSRITHHVFNAFQTTDSGLVYVDATPGKGECLIAKKTVGIYQVVFEAQNPIPQTLTQKLGAEEDFVFFW